MRALLPLLLLACSCVAQAEEFAAQVIAVLDGDTILIKRANALTKIRLAEIDAPEVGHAGMGGQPANSQKDQAYGMASKQSLSDMVLNKQVRVSSRAVDDYGRLVAHVSVSGLDVNEEQLKRGMAWEYSFHHGNQAYIGLQDEARRAGRGLWAQRDPLPPWAWRKQHPSVLAAPMKTASPAAHAALPDPPCGKKKHCSEMASCAEARHYFAACGHKGLDGDGDGTPCDSLCAAGK